MKKLLLIIIACLLLSGCWIKGQGRSVGYVTTVETESVLPWFQWDTVWFRVETGTMSSMQSKPEQYAILRNKIQLKNALMDTVKKHQKIEILYNQHVANAAASPDEIVDFTIIGE